MTPLGFEHLTFLTGSLRSTDSRFSAMEGVLLIMSMCWDDYHYYYNYYCYYFCC